MWASGSGQQFEIQAGNTQLKGYLQITNPQALGQGSKSGVRASGHRRETGRERAAFQTIDLEVRKKTDARQQKVPGVEGRSKMGVMCSRPQLEQRYVLLSIFFSL